MGENSTIEWTDATWNPTIGCTRVFRRGEDGNRLPSGCDHCYAFTLHDRRHAAWKRGRFPTAPAQYHQPFSVMQLLPARMGEPLRWRRPRRVFVNSLSDLFHEDVPDGFIAWVWYVMAQCPQHTFQILTKRPERMLEWVTRWGDLGGETWDFKGARGAEAVRAAHPSGRGQLFAAMLDQWGDPPPGAAYPLFDWLEGPIRWPRDLRNVWLGVSVSIQEDADERLPLLRRTPAAVRFMSGEPLLGPLELMPHLPDLDWVIIGGESGPRHREMDLDWARSVRNQCLATGTAFFLKQMGGATPKSGGRLLDGREHSEFPEPLLAAAFR